jgi:tyrosinase
MFVRRDVWSMDAWAPTIAWYEKAVAALRALPIDNPRSWLSLAAMHGINIEAWKAHGYLPNHGQPPVIAPEFRQCQHQTWYFLPWHRGYLASFEAIVRQKIVELGGPADWALPYWNYNGTRPDSIRLPTAFGSEKKLDGSANALWVSARYGTDGKGHIEIQPKQIDPSGALREAQFTDGFGGPVTGFNPSGQHNGRLESRPHNTVHGLVGGQQVPNPTKPEQRGLMTSPQTAALDPIFWLHHSNIDRMWEVWLHADPQHTNPPAHGDWSDGPPANGRPFRFPGTDGAWHNTQVHAIASAADLHYQYDDIVTPLPFGAVAAPRAATPEGRCMPYGPAREFAASAGAVQLGADFTEVTVRLDTQSKPAAAAATTPGGPVAPSPRVLLSLDGIRSVAGTRVMSDGVLIDVAVVHPVSGEELDVGTISMFGLTIASDPAELHGGGGLAELLDITRIFDDLQQSGAVGDELSVRFRKSTPMSDMSNIAIGKVSLLRQS